MEIGDMLLSVMIKSEFQGTFTGWAEVLWWWHETEGVWGFVCFSGQTPRAVASDMWPEREASLVLVKRITRSPHIY